MSLHRLWLPLALAASLGLLGGPAFAEPEEEDDISAQVRKQMEKIIRLMRENEEALLRLSTGAGGDPVPVPLPEVPPGEEAPRAEPPAGEGEPGEEAVRRLEELLRRQREGSERIPRELEELVRMIPQ